MVIYVLKNIKTGQFVKEVRFYQGADNCGHIGIDFTDNMAKALEIKAVAYEPNQTRLAETLTSLTDAIYKAIVAYEDEH